MMNPTVRFETTPNPQTLRFTADEAVARMSGQSFTEKPVEFKNAAEAQFSPLAKKLFGFPWAAGVYIGRDFITVTKQDWVDWDIIAEPLAGLIEEHLDSGAPVVNAPKAVDTSASSTTGVVDPADKSMAQSGDSAAVVEIKRVLNEEIRPMVAQDGGDVEFSKFEDGVVYLHMRGSCAGCPSSTATLKLGIETRLQEAVPEIREVLAI
jgi:NFU1 iron-sulfur cluster scaffold homolog, mitochondrial